MTDDAELLRRYAHARSEQAFAQLAQRHLSLVYHAALRRTSHPQMAEEVTQYVFIVLARKAAELSRHAVLTGWLYTTTRFASNRILRAERRRHFREQKAFAMQNIPSKPEPDWEQLRPALDGVLDKLSDRDRAAVLLRYFEGRSFAEVGRALRLSEEAARKRVDRSIDKLRRMLERRGLTSTSAALALALSSQAGLATPAGLAPMVIGPALAGSEGAVGPGATAAIELMSTTKATLGLAAIIGIAAILGIPAVGTAIREIRENRAAQAALSAATQQMDTESAALHALEQKAQALEQAHLKLLASGEGGNAGSSANRHADAVAAGGAGSAAGSHPGTLDPLAEGQKFLNSFPQARALLLKANASELLSLAPFERQNNLTAGQIQQLHSIMAEKWADNLLETPTGIALGPDNNPTIDELSPIIGDQAAQEYDNYRQTMQYPYKFTTMAAVAAGQAGTPLSAGEVDQLAQIIAANSAPYQVIPGTMGPGNWNTAATSVNWDAAIAQAQAALPPTQFSAVQGSLKMIQLQASLIKMQQSQANP